MSADDGLPLEDQAAALFIRQQRADWSAQDQAELDRWLIEPAHRRAFQKIRHTWQGIEPHATSPELMALREAALRRSRGSFRSTAAQLWAGPGRSWRWALGCLALLFVAALSALLAGAHEANYRTGFGQRRVIELADRSEVAMDQGTVLRVRMSRDARVVDLIEGQAQFMVAHDRRRPFLVDAGPSTITAVGTSFNVQYLDARMQLDMVEGRVVVSASKPADPAHRTLDLTTGEELRVEPGGQTQLVRDADVAAATAWRDGRIIFKNTALGEAVKRLNRYSVVQLRISDADLARERINGVFELGDALVFAEAIQSTLGVQMQRIGPRVLLLSPAP